MSDFDWFFEEVGSGVKTLVEKFMEMPYFFYSEQDMHAYLYHKLISGKRIERFLLKLSPTFPCLEESNLDSSNICDVRGAAGRAIIWRAFRGFSRV